MLKLLGTYYIVKIATFFSVSETQTLLNKKQFCQGLGTAEPYSEHFLAETQVTIQLILTS